MMHLVEEEVDYGEVRLVWKDDKRTHKKYALLQKSKKRKSKMRLWKHLKCQNHYGAEHFAPPPALVFSAFWSPVVELAFLAAPFGL